MPEAIEEEVGKDVEDRVDEHAIQTFHALGYRGRLPDKIVASYLQVKRVKDRLSPGRLSAEGFAMVIAIASW